MTRGEAVDLLRNHFAADYREEGFEGPALRLEEIASAIERDEWGPEEGVPTMAEMEATRPNGPSVRLTGITEAPVPTPEFGPCPMCGSSAYQEEPPHA